MLSLTSQRMGLKHTMTENKPTENLSFKDNILYQYITAFQVSSLRIMGGQRPADKCQLHLSADLWNVLDADFVALH